MENGFDLWYYIFNESILLRSLSIEVVIYGDMYKGNENPEIAEYVYIRKIWLYTLGCFDFYDQYKNSQSFNCSKCVCDFFAM